MTIKTKKWKSDLLRIDSIAYEGMRRYDHKLKKQKSVILPKRKLKGGDSK